MCGIAGIVRFGNAPILEEQISLLLAGNEHRGVDATGIAVAFKDGNISVFKDDEPAWKFIASKEYFAFLEKNLNEETWAVLLHTRAATQGSPRDMKNNHPMFAGKSAIIHNGMISNDNALFNSLGLTRKAETDSDIIRAIADKHGVNERCIKELNKICGGVATAIVSPADPKKMILGRSGNPLTIASNEQQLFFSSERNTIDRALKPWTKRFGMFFQMKRADAAFAPFADNTAWLIGENGLEGHFQFKTLGGTYREPNRQVYERYKERQRRWDASKPVVRLKAESGVDEVICSDAKCGMTWNIPHGAKPNKYVCNKDQKGCGARLKEMPKVN